MVMEKSTEALCGKLQDLLSELQSLELTQHEANAELARAEDEAAKARQKVGRARHAAYFARGKVEKLARALAALRDECTEEDAALIDLLLSRVE